MLRRSLMAGLLALPFTSAVANATSRGVSVLSNRTLRWKVPKNIERVRVRAWNEHGKLVMDTNLNVDPNQIFQIDVIE